MSAIGRNTIYNLAGFAVPLALFVVSIPLYIHLIGAARFGVLSIVWLVLGLFGMLDFGIGRAATQKIASLRGGSADERRAALGTALASNVVIGGAGVLLMAGVAYGIFAHGMKLEPWLRAEAMPIIPLMAIGVPVVTTIGILSGALQGRERFLATNRITIANAALFQMVPLGVAWLFGPTLWPLVLAAICARLVAVWMLWRACQREFDGVRLRHWRQDNLLEMLRYGGWVMGAAVIGIIVLYTDRFLIGALVGPIAVTTYTVAVDATVKVSHLSSALMATMFPQFAGSADKIDALSDKAVRYLFAIATPVVLFGIMASDVVFPLWLGSEIGPHSAQIAKISLIGAWAVVFGKLGYMKLQANNEPEKLTLALLGEVLITIPILVFMLAHFGLLGAAMSFTLRQVADAILLNWLAFRRTRYLMPFLLGGAYLSACSYFTGFMLDYSLAARAGVTAALLVPVVVASHLAAPRLHQILLGMIFRGGGNEQTPPLSR
ncbi:MAG: oligosaccharide flippase family protein [Novosphingobium sp.]